MTDRDVIAAIRKTHLKANIDDATIVNHYWAEATVDPGGSLFGPGPYLKLPVDQYHAGGLDRVVIRVYPPARLRRRLAHVWKGTR